MPRRLVKQLGARVAFIYPGFLEAPFARFLNKVCPLNGGIPTLRPGVAFIYSKAGLLDGYNLSVTFSVTSSRNQINVLCGDKQCTHGRGHR